MTQVQTGKTMGANGGVQGEPKSVVYEHTQQVIAQARAAREGREAIKADFPDLKPFSLTSGNGAEQGVFIKLDELIETPFVCFEGGVEESTNFQDKKGNPQKQAWMRVSLVKDIQEFGRENAPRYKVTTTGWRIMAQISAIPELEYPFLACVWEDVSRGRDGYGNFPRMLGDVPPSILASLAPESAVEGEILEDGESDDTDDDTSDLEYDEESGAYVLKEEAAQKNAERRHVVAPQRTDLSADAQRRRLQNAAGRRGN